MIVTFRNVPSSAENIAEWYRRLVELNGGMEPRSNGYAASREISTNFQNLSKNINDMISINSFFFLIAGIL